MTSALPTPALPPEIPREEIAVPVKQTLFCSICVAQRDFVLDRECEFGLLGTCPGCGDERIVSFTRMISEVA